MLLQPDGAIVAAGEFLSVGGLPIAGLTRLLDPNVLPTRAAQGAADQLRVWPVPAHEQLSVATNQAFSSLELINMLGQSVVRQAATTSVSTVDLRHQPAGLYILRVSYPGGTVITRRVVLE